MVFKILTRLTLLVVVLALSFAATTTTQAASYFYKNVPVSAECAVNYVILHSPLISYNFPDNAVLSSSVYVNGILKGYSDYSFGPGASDPGTVYSNFAMGFFGGYPATITLTEQLFVDNKLASTNTITVACEGLGAGVMSLSFTLGDGSGKPGPSIPAGFVLRTITCNTSVFAEPGGAPVANAKVTAGQTWYVNPIPVKDAGGQSWTEIFVGGYNKPFIPTGCVQ